MKRELTLVLLTGCMACTSRPHLPAPQFPLTPTEPTLAGAVPLLQAEPKISTLPKIETFTLSNGLRLVVLERHLWPHASIGFITMRGGEDGAELEDSGLASVVSELVLSAGVKPPDDGPAAPKAESPSRDEATATAEPESHWIAFSRLGFQHGAGLAAQVRTSDVKMALEAMAEHVQQPPLDRDALLRARRSVASNLSDGRDTLEGVGRNHVMQRLYGPSHTLGQHAKLAMERADKHELDMVVAGYRARFVPRASALVVAGDVDPEALRATVENLFGGWKGDGQAPAQYAKPTWQPRGKRKVFLHASSARQALIAIGQQGPAPSSPDYIPFRALVHILAGSTGSRLFAALRAEQEATYHVGASLPVRKDGSTLLIETATARDTAEPAVTRILGEMARLQRELVSDAELRRAKLALLDNVASDFSSDESAMLTLAHLLSLGRDPSAPQADMAAILALTPQVLREVAKRTLQPASAPVFVIGDLNGYGKLGQWAQSDDEMLP